MSVAVVDNDCTVIILMIAERYKIFVSKVPSNYAYNIALTGIQQCVSDNAVVPLQDSAKIPTIQKIERVSSVWHYATMGRHD